MENMRQGTHITKMGEMAENIPNAPQIFGPICLPKPKSLGLSEKRSLWLSVVCEQNKCATIIAFPRDNIRIPQALTKAIVNAR